MSEEKEIVLSLISHTNVGKTALARTLLRQDVGEVADSAHVTVIPERYTLIESEGSIAYLWDTPGFGSNLAKLAKRLRSSKNPVGWILHQVWDRSQDKSLWCSQEAIRNVQADADLVLYLVDASQSPLALSYVDLEIEIIEWIQKPVLVFLNQTGAPDAEQDRLNEAEWQAHLSKHEIVKSVSTLDAFTRSWTQEHEILGKAVEVLGGKKGKTAKALQKAWLGKNLDIFDESVTQIAGLAHFSLSDVEPLPEENLLEKVKKQILNRKEHQKELEQIQKRMYERLADETKKTVNSLISIHGLDGETAARLEEASGDKFSVKRNVEESLIATFGGAVSGLVGGLSADLISGGMTFGGGALVGMLLGGATTFSLAYGFNLTQAGQNMVRWSEAHFLNQVETITMLYLAISHYGRGRGSWQDPINNPGRWQTLVKERLNANEDAWRKLWKKGGIQSEPGELQKPLEKQIKELLTDVFTTLYPESASIFR
ncbi:MAG: DUF3482 domain-containing protein [Verrucomicrobiales bacterium]|nr:DUF3482 domain-containing protein [Verrucomicrobiales bacterium]